MGLFHWTLDRAEDIAKWKTQNEEGMLGKITSRGAYRIENEIEDGAIQWAHALVWISDGTGGGLIKLYDTGWGNKPWETYVTRGMLNTSDIEEGSEPFTQEFLSLKDGKVGSLSQVEDSEWESRAWKIYLTRAILNTSDTEEGSEQLTSNVCFNEQWNALKT